MGKLTELLAHPDELYAAIQVKYLRKPLYPRDPKSESASLRRCYELLDHSSRSFAAVIQELHPELRDTVMLFYVVLRGLDTIEDDMSLSNDVKIPLLRNFKEKLSEKGWQFHDSGPNEKDRVVLQDFDVVIEELTKIKPEYREVIFDIAEKMGNGMADYVIREQQKNYDGLKTINDYTIYCHHVAGVVGEGLTRLALLSGFGTEVLEEKPQLMESMGQFLQKTNIIRDFREDLDDGRSFWPKEVWGKYANELSEFTDPTEKAVYCVSDLVVLSLECVTDCLEYLQNVKEPTLFSFCAIPQVMSIATLELVFNNADMFRKHLKIRRGTTAKLILSSGKMEDVFEVFRNYTRKIHLRNNSEDPNFMRIEVLCGKIEQYINEHTREADEKLRAKKEREYMERMIVVAGVGGLSIVCGIMVFAAWLLGARFDIVLFQIKDFWWQMRHTPGEHMPNYDERLAAYYRPAGHKLATTVKHAINAATTAKVHGDL